MKNLFLLSCPVAIYVDNICGILDIRVLVLYTRGSGRLPFFLAKKGNLPSSCLPSPNLCQSRGLCLAVVKVERGFCSALAAAVLRDRRPAKGAEKHEEEVECSLLRT